MHTNMPQMPHRNLIAGALLVFAVIVLARRDGLHAERLASITVGTGTTLPTTSTSYTTLMRSTTTITLGRLCGDPIPDRVIRASDALFALNTAVSLVTCELCVCDVDGSGGIAATDAAILLRVAVGQNIELACPAC